MTSLGLVTDEPTERTVYESLTIEEQERFLDGIRERRLRALVVYEELQAAKQLIANEKLAAKVERLCKKVGKYLEAAEKAINGVEAMHKEIRAARILMETEA